jgi:hypothetical protein
VHDLLSQVNHIIEFLGQVLQKLDGFINRIIMLMVSQQCFLMQTRMHVRNGRRVEHTIQ